MTYEYVNSSTLRSVSYDEDKRLLEVEIFYGGTFQYSGVPINIYHSLMKPPSVGKYFYKYIKHVYPETRVY